jgi:hypothetical protein
VAGEALVCDDGDACNGVESCDEASGCVAGEALVCNDGSYCNGIETCDSISGCVPGSSPCVDGVACTVDGCDEATDSCTHEVSQAACDDGLFCNGTESCDPVTGCTAGEPLDCSDADSTCGVGTCDEATQDCAVAPANEGTVCGESDGVCTLSALCGDGECVVETLCDPQCELCKDGECFSLCGNPYDSTLNLVTVVDGLYSLRAAVNLEECALCVCDVTGNGVISAVDTLAILRYVVGTDSDMHCPEPAGEESATTTTTLVTTTTLLD